MQGSYIGYYSGFPSLGGGFDSRTLLQITTAPHRGAVVIFRRAGIERAAPVRTLVQKLRAGEQFLARGRFHESLDAAGMAVDAVSSRQTEQNLD